MTLEDVSDCTRDSLIAREIGWNKDRIRTEVLRSKCRHRRSHSKLSCFVGGGAYDRSSTPPGDDDRFAAKTWIIALFHRSVEGVHVDVHDLPRWRCHPVAIAFDRLHLVSTSDIALLSAAARLRHVRSRSRAREPAVPQGRRCSRRVPPTVSRSWDQARSTFWATVSSNPPL